MANLQVHQLPQVTKLNPVDMLPIESASTNVLGYATVSQIASYFNRYQVFVPANTVFFNDGFTNSIAIVTLSIANFVGPYNNGMHIKYVLTNNGTDYTENFILSGEVFMTADFSGPITSNTINSNGDGYGYKITAHIDGPSETVGIFFTLDDSNPQRTTTNFSLNSDIVGYLDILLTNNGVAA